MPMIASVLLAAASFFGACSQNNAPESASPGEAPEPDRTTFAKGADVSWVTQLEKEGEKFYNKEGKPTECMQLLRDECGVNAIRLRVWVNPKDGWNGIEDVMVKARRAKALGLRLMIDFHFSDHWADPGQQETPDAWKSYDMSQLKKAVAAHVEEMLGRLKAENIEPEWVQVGNETRTGMLYPLGNSKNEQNFTDLANAGYDAVKSVFPGTAVIIHIDNGYQLDLYTYIFSILKRCNGKYDMIGMSLYPSVDDWREKVNSCVANINTLAAMYGRPVMICEIGMDYDRPKESEEFVATLKEKCEKETGGNCKGIFWWEPEAPAGYNGGYNKGCFKDGHPTEALNAFKEN